jgi:hypothetical protein
MKSLVSRIIKFNPGTLVLIGLTLNSGCGSSAKFVSEQSVADKVARIRLGQTTRAEVETIFGTDHGKDSGLWIYSVADTELRMAQPQRGSLSAILPFIAENAATNTRAVVSVWFTDDGNVKGLEFARYFDAPFVNDYWYLIQETEQNALESVVRVGEMSDLKVVGLDKAAGTFSLEDETSKARIVVKLEKQTLHITSENPHDRLSREYRTFSKKELAFTGKVSLLK